MAYAKKRQGPRGTRYTGVYLDPQGKERSAGTFSTEAEALAAANTKAVQVGRSTWKDPTHGQMLFGAFVLQWAERKMWADTTRASNMSRLQQHVLPALGHKTLQQVATYATLTAAYDKIANTPSQRTGIRVTAKTLREIMVLVAQALDEAVKFGYIENHAAASVEKPRPVREHLDALTPAQAGDLLAAFKPTGLVLVETLLETGARWGEGTAFRAGDLVGNRLRIARAVHTLTKKGAAEALAKKTPAELAKQPWPGTQYLLVDYTKNGDRRTVTCSPRLCALLTAHIEALNLGPDDFLFLRPNGLPQDRGSWRQTHWEPAVRKAGLGHLPRVWVHDLRAAHASWLLSGGANLGDVMRRLGWSQMQTVQRYERPLPDAEERMMGIFSSMRDRTPHH